MSYGQARRYVLSDLATCLQRSIHNKGLSCRATAGGIGIALAFSFLPSLLFLVKGRSRPKPDTVHKTATCFHADLCYHYELAGYKPYESHYEVIPELEEEILNWEPCRGKDRSGCVLSFGK